jgi:CspA family cold shock protein
MAKGTIKTLMKDRGFGFIQVEGGGDDVFFHSSSMGPGEYDTLQMGQAVEFDVEPDPRNASRKRAANIKVSG